MNRVAYGFLLVLLFSFASRAFGQDGPVTQETVDQFNKIITLIKKNDARALAEKIIFPLKRSKPLPPVLNKSDFIKYFPVIFDQKFKLKAGKVVMNDIMYDNDRARFGLVNGEKSKNDWHGDIWTDENGSITSINYSSQREEIMIDSINKAIKKQMHPSVQSWSYNVLLAKSEKWLIRIDYTDKGVRYASWKANQKMSEKPELILEKGKEESKGTMGGWLWTFTSGKWIYVVDQDDFCEDIKDHFILSIYLGDKLKAEVHLKEIEPWEYTP